MQTTTLKKQEKNFKIDVVTAPDTSNDNAESTDFLIDVPAHLQPSLDCVLDYYTDNALKPVVKLCGGLLDVVSDFIRQIEATLPPTLINYGRDIIDFIISNLCEFCREKSVTHMTFNFSFNRKNESAIA